MTAILSIEEVIKARAISLGFSLAGVTTPNPLREHQRYIDWLNSGYHAGMNYLANERHVKIRSDPHFLQLEVRSILVLGYPYPLHSKEYLNPGNRGLISGYASGEDYHTLFPKLLRPLVDFLNSEFGPNCVLGVYTDSSPILERELAVRAGLGWIGRNSCVISPKVGSAFLLAEVFLSASLKPDEPFQNDHCGKCMKCVDACPTGSILPDRIIDSNRCISYHLIENHAFIPEEIKSKAGNWIFGCDICQMVCPWNRNTDTASKDMHIDLASMTNLLQISETDFHERFRNTALERAKRIGLVRNILIRFGNLRDVTCLRAIHRLIESHPDPILVDTADWAVNQIESANSKI